MGSNTPAGRELGIPKIQGCQNFPGERPPKFFLPDLGDPPPGIRSYFMYAVTHGAWFLGCHFHNSGLPVCAESAQRAEQSHKVGLKLPAGQQLRFRVATSLKQGCLLTQNQPKGLSGPAERARKEGFGSPVGRQVRYPVIQGSQNFPGQRRVPC